MCVVGAVGGIMIRLLIENPEMFVAVLRIGSTVGAFVLAVATIIWVGVRGAQPGRALVVTGCVLLLTPIVVNFGMLALIPTGNPLQLMSTKRLIANRLPAQIDTPWVWRILEDRIASGDLSKEDADAAVMELVKFMNAQPGGWDRPLSWQQDFLQKAIAAKLVSEPTLLKLFDAFFGKSPSLTHSFIGPNEVNYSVEVGSTWASQSGLGVELLWDINKAELDGKPLQIKRLQRWGKRGDVTFGGEIGPGPHTLLVEFECAYIDEGVLLDPDSTPADEWPKARKRWKVKQTKSFDGPQGR
jgi:hypothetical protein